MARRLAAIGFRISLGLALAAIAFVAAAPRDLPAPVGLDFAAPEIWPKRGEPNGLEAIVRAVEGLDDALPEDLDQDELPERLRPACDPGFGDAALVRALHADVRPGLEALERALDGPPVRFASGRFDLRSAELDRLDALFWLTALIRAEGCIAEQGEAARAVRDATTGIELAARLRGAPFLELWSYAVFQMYAGRSLTGIERALPHWPASAAELRALSRSLESTRASADDWKRALRGELTFALAQVNEFDWRAAGCEQCPPTALYLALPDGYAFQPHRTISEIAARYRDFAERADRPCRVGVPPPPLIPPRPYSVLRSLGPNGVGAVHFEQTHDVMEYQLAMRCKLSRGSRSCQPH